MNRSEMIKGFMDLFVGSDVGYGLYDPDATSLKTGTHNNDRGRFRTVYGKITEKQWEDHIDGVRRLAVCPVQEDGTCSFAALDVDYSDVSINDMLLRLTHEDGECQLVGARSKSGNIHLYHFFNNCPAVVAHARMLCFATDLRIDMSRTDVFPRNGAGRHKDGGVGPCILMPYFGGNGEVNSRDYEPEAVEKFLAKAEASKRYAISGGVAAK
jgi:hypothetical protein